MKVALLVFFLSFLSQKTFDNLIIKMRNHKRLSYKVSKQYSVKIDRTSSH